MRTLTGITLLVWLLLPINPAMAEVTQENRNPTVTVEAEAITSLEGNWRVKKGDRLEYREPGYDDSGWQTASVPGNLMDLFPGHRGFAWYRITLRFPEEKDTSCVAVLGKINDADEVYFNGKLIGRTGDLFSKKSHAFDRLRAYSIPRKLIRYGGDNTLAVRMRGYLNDSAGMIWGAYYIGPGPMINNTIFIQLSLDILLIGIYSFLGIYFLLFSFRSSNLKKQQQLFSIITFSFGLYIFCQGQIKYLFTDNFSLFHHLQYYSGLTGTGAMVLFFRSVMQKKLNIPDKIAVAALVAAAVAVTFIPEIRHWTIPRIAWHFVIVYISLAVFRDLLQTLVRKRWEYLYVYLGFTLILMVVLIEVLRAYSLVPDFEYLKFGVAGLVILVSFFMADQVSMMQQIEAKARRELENEVTIRTRELTERNTEIENQLEIARLIQKKLLPSDPPRHPGIEIVFSYIPVDKVGGDFYDFIETEENLTLIIGDVSGHGVPGAFLALIAKLSFNQMNPLKMTPSRILSRMNEIICESSVMSHFITAFVFSIDTKNNLAYFSSAGHHPALLINESGTSCRELHTKGTPLGWQSGLNYSIGEQPLNKGDRIVLYTDGITECLNRNRQLYGERRLQELIIKTRNRSAKECVETLVEDLKSFSEGIIDDDISIVIVDITE